ncbi:E3 ubiquitin-protein ligase RGLG2 [Hibiscus syriacus]|uniref:E3 ubiquitin-protein ligase RGLG2 n=1 Tax=Hibiscus syriacus TaxID=106335 RepID=A0A6A2YE56_HIBSY|nr:E3 ubiquitin-protein ligase RGLG4-like [Hibiscus syriacus]XP_039030158.1 E3 ubiquitin-protein ligase RGLG4-like [Hibiscus syriacus]KAE8677246.1 E3 ubiquitin-protein ligase RGLG2 [Hibiscus syriacus]
MGNFLAKQKRKHLQFFKTLTGRTSDRYPTVRPMADAEPRLPSYGEGSTSQIINNPSKASKLPRKQSTKDKYRLILDNFSTLDQVTRALREAGLESSNLILGIDFTKSNEWTGKVSFNNRSLHAIGDTPNPYEQAITIIGKTLAPFDEDNLIPCFGFGDATTHDTEVFSFHTDRSSCHGFEEVLDCYRKTVPNLRLAGPTSYAPVIDAAVDIVENSSGQFHVLVIIADGQVTRSSSTSDGELSPQEEQTISAVVNASLYPLAIVLVGVGDGPWEDMKKFDDKIPSREFDNFQFVNFTGIMTKNTSQVEKETAFALAALMEIPFQYKACMELGSLGHRTGKAKKVVPRPPPVSYRRPAPPQRTSSNVPASPAVSSDDQQSACPICLTNTKDLAFNCGHTTCRDCGQRVSNCPICRQSITNRLRLFT